MTTGNDATQKNKEPFVYHIGLKLGLEYQGEDFPCKKTILEPIEEFIRNHLKPYKSTTQIILFNSSMVKSGWEEEVEDEGD